MDIMSNLLAAFASAFNQDNRLFSLHFTASWLDEKLLPHTLSGNEFISSPFLFEIECLCDDAGIELKSLIGQGVDIVIHRDESDRVISGIVTRAQQLGSDGGFSRYGLTVEPAFAVLKLRRNSRVFQDKSVIGIIGLILDEHIRNNPVFAQCFRHQNQITQTCPTRSYCQQYRESDFDFITRLLREEGISYRFDFEHGADETGLHTLVLFDAGSELNSAQHDSIRFHRADATEQEDSITQWQASRQIQASSVAIASFDYKGVYTQHGSDATANDQGQRGSGLASSLENYDPQPLYYGSDNSELNRYARLRRQASDLQIKKFSGSGTIRGLGAGQIFALIDHPNHDDDNEFVVLSQAVEARNNLPAEFDTHPVTAITRKPFTLDAAGYRNNFEAVRKQIAIVPAYAQTDHARPTARGVQTATVVGPAGEEIYTDELGRIKIQFHWARPQDHDTGRHGASAEKNDFSSCWVRVQMPGAGAQWGYQFIPRIGQEVVVDFIEGDIDRPVVTHVVHNGQQTPPTFQNAGSLPANKTLSGIKTCEYKGSRHNEIIFDDTTSEIRAALSTEHGRTQLNQGYLIHPRSEGKGNPRGEGFELRTDNAGAIRAAHGLLVTTEAQPDARGNQMDRSPALAQLEAAQNLTMHLSDIAQRQRANTSNPDPALNADQLKDKKPHLLMHGHGGVALTTPQSLTLASGRDFNQISLRDTHHTSGGRWIHNVGESISLFAANTQQKIKTSIKVIVAKGDVLIQAQSNDTDISAEKNVSITACKSTLTASAGKEFLLQSGGGYIRIGGGNIDIHCPGKLSMKAKHVVHESGGSGRVATPMMPEGMLTALSPGQVMLASASAAPAATASAQKAARWKARRQQIADAKAKTASMPAGEERTTLINATERFEKNNVAVEKARLSADVYKPEEGPPPGWKNISDDPEQLATIGLKTNHLKERNSNFRAQVYAPDPDVFGEDMKTTVSFKGTDFNCREDWANNIAQGIDRESLYYKKAVTIGRDLERQGANVEITGHSLGGGLGSAAARASGKPAITFNAAGLHKNTVTRYGGIPVITDPDNIQAYRVQGEVLTGVQEQNLGGTTMTAGAGGIIGALIGGPAGAIIGASIGAAAKTGVAAGMSNAAGIPHTVAGSRFNPVDRHGMVQVIDGIERQKQEDQAILSKQVGGPDEKG